ncbi:MAG: hypothetical protein J2P46_20200, partial [Zavarzinella sp.]|nr:hypothetical protein [Zavarzinella sp.]
MRRVVAAVIVLGFTAAVRAGIYSPNEPFVFEIDADGFATPIQFSGGFDSILAGYREVAMLPPNPGAPPNRRRQEALDRVKEREAKGVSALSPPELAGLTADLIRLNRNDEALNILQPLARDRIRGGFLAYAHLARAHAGRGEWREAFDQQEMAIRYTEFPTAFPGLNKTQLAWLKRVERDYYLPFLAHRAEEARRGRASRLHEDPDPIFPSAVPPKRPDNPVQFVGEDGKYAVGTIAAAERKKLPPDALAIMQQLVLWHPQDARLYWQLGELYNATGDVETAAGILDVCTYAMGYSNPTVIEHRRVLKAAADSASAARAVEAS